MLALIFENQSLVLCPLSNNHLLVFFDDVVFVEAVDSIDGGVLEPEMLVFAYFGLEMGVRVLGHFVKKGRLLKHLLNDLVFRFFLFEKSLLEF